MSFLHELKLKNCLEQALESYFKKSSRCNEKCLWIHTFIKQELEKSLSFPYSVEMEKNIRCLNTSCKKKCDIVIFFHDEPFMIIPIKFICRNYKQNRNNYLESLTGESYLIKSMYPTIKIIPFNIYIENCRYYNKNNEYLKDEKITLQDVEIMNRIDLFQQVVFIFLNINYEKQTIHKIINFTSIIDIVQNNSK